MAGRWHGLSYSFVGFYGEGHGMAVEWEEPDDWRGDRRYRSRECEFACARWRRLRMIPATRGWLNKE
jgi:hypothetical protein